ncbi:hypothetical protein FAGAP_13294, partial [Fusarium agapanthi]
IRGTSDWEFQMKNFLLARARVRQIACKVVVGYTNYYVQHNQEKVRGLRAEADNLETWWMNDTKAAARHNIDGEKLAAKEGGPSSIDDLFEQTCLEIAAKEAEEAEEAENAGSEN